LFQIIQKEISSYFNSFIGYLVIGLYLLLSGFIFWIYPSTSILAHGYAQLDGYFNTAPFLLMILIPIIGMRTFASEQTEGTLDWLRTKPISSWALVMGKMIGSWLIFCVAILSTWIYVYTLSQLAIPIGSLDYSGIVGSFVGLLLLGAGFVSISVFFSAMTSHPAVAFLASFLTCFLFIYGFEALQEMGFWTAFWHRLESWSMSASYQSLRRGVMDTRALFYFAGIVLLFSALSQRMIANRSLSVRWKKDISIVLFALIWISYGASNGPFIRWDLTKDKRFTLSNASKEVLSNLSQPVQMTLLLEGSLPSGFKRIRQATLDLVDDMKAYAGGKIDLKLLNPLSGNEEEQQKLWEQLMQMGVQPLQLNLKTQDGSRQQMLFPVALVRIGDRTEVIDLLPNRQVVDPQESLNKSIQNLEYAFISVLNNHQNFEAKPLLGFTEGHGELPDWEMADAIHTLSSRYEVGRIRLDQIDLDGIRQLSVLIIAQPQTAFSEAEKFKIDHFVLHGGQVVWAIDQLDGHLDSLRQQTQQQLIARDLRLDDMLFTYGFRFNYDVVADLQSTQIPLAIGPSGNSAQVALQPWPFHPVLQTTNRHPLVKDLDGLSSMYVGTMDTVAVEGLRRVPILQTSNQSRRLQPPLVLDMNALEIYLDPSAYQEGPYNMGYLAQGTFPSVFYQRPIPAGIDTMIRMEPVGKPSKMIAIADGDIFRNQIHPEDRSPYPLGWSRYEQQQYGNKAFLVNLMDYLSGNETLLALRTKELPIRLLDGQRVRNEKGKWQFVNVGFPVLLLLLFAVVQQRWRKHIYGRKWSK
jgi:ABC-2 type transport system permease protein